ncbi:MAG: pyridoxal phosphate-dependent aminotransferase [Gammaproteobacteria bacterium]|nr:pyridoxal phosphate-dependent aminotransferase [Gammaproteobacteria bacterium]MBU1625019.1 pyridoxal phosphate-dependent aminotransferase [Gammaproteobacteria bacterium]MBU1981279.1 pyridoxal phosphate-dependent aminotransferase [Gammaproteobacteria bacterium]
MDKRFDSAPVRPNTASLKYDLRREVFGRADVIPLWVADMDFAVPEAVQRALTQRAEHPVFGYTIHPDSMYDAQIHWLSTRHGWNVTRGSILFCPGVVPSLHACIMALTQPGDGVIVQPPVYAPFLTAAQTCGRKSLLNPLKLDAGRYTFDLEDLERCAQAGGRMLILCSPHNPVGRVWQQEELQALLAVCEQYDITVVSDEIHADLIYPGFQHVALATLNSKVKIVTAVAPSKTFNIPGLGLSALIVPEASDRKAITQAFDTLHVSACNPFSIAAFEAAYREGAPWLDDLMGYLAGTRDMVRDYLRQQLPQIKMVEPQGTYLLWLDCREMGMSDKQLKDFFVQKAGVGMSPGAMFGTDGSGYMRMNIGAPRSLINQALENISVAMRD